MNWRAWPRPATGQVLPRRSRICKVSGEVSFDGQPLERKRGRLGDWPLVGAEEWEAVRDAFLMPLDRREVREVDWYFRARRGEFVCPSADPDLNVATAAQKYGAARFEALYRQWLQRGAQALWAMQLPLLRDNIQRGLGRVEFVPLPHQYLQLTPLIGSSSGVEKGFIEGDNLPTA